MHGKMIMKQKIIQNSKYGVICTYLSLYSLIYKIKVLILYIVNEYILTTIKIQ